MTSTLNIGNLKTTIALIVAFFATMTVALAQNLVVNGDFEQTSGFDYQSISDYVRIWGGGVHEGEFIHDATSNGHGVGTLGWPSNLTGYGGSGYYLLFNGFGGSVNPSKAAWRQTVAVTTNTTYTFSAQVRNLAQGYMGMNPNPAIMRLKINNQQVGTDLTLPTNNNWNTWTITWNSGSATQAVIEIVDAYVGQSSQGDDFGLDHISFIPNVVYSVEAIDDWDVLACQGVAVDIDVLANDAVLPNTNDATVSVVTNPSHGSAQVLTNKKIRYTFAGGDYTTDQLKYRVTNHGVTDEAWVHINTNRLPQVGNITAPGPICANGALGIPTPTVSPSGLTGQWQKSTAQNGNYTNFDPTNIPLSMNGNWVRYLVTNACGDGYSNSVQITVTNGPSFSAQTPQIQPICDGQSLTLTPPAFNANGSQILSQGWVASPTETGEYSSFSPNNISVSYNGWFIRYMVEGSCGFVYSSPARQLTVNVAPNISGTLQAPSTICAGDDLDVIIPTNDGNGTGAWEICQTQNGTYQSFSILNVPSTYDNWYLHYKLSNDCGIDVSNPVQIHVNDAPTIATPATPQAICAGGSLNLATPSIQNQGATITGQGWQIAATQNGSYNQFNNNEVPYSYNGYWIRYYAENACGITYSVAVQITVNDTPIVGNVTAPSAICAGQSFNLTAPSVTWRHVNQGTVSWEIQINGTWQPLNNNNIPFAYNGCLIRYKAVNGCGTSYSSNNVQVTVYSTDPIDEGEITACDAIYHHGQYCNHNGTYVADSITPNGCTIQVSWHFTLGEAYIAPVQIEETCDSYYWPKTHQTYYETDIYQTTITSPDPQVCDSTFTLDLTINHAPQITGNLQTPSDICAGNSLVVSAPTYQMNHNGGGTTRWDYANSQNGPFHAFDPMTYHLEYGSYYLRFAVINGCDSIFSNVVPFHVNDRPVINGQLGALQVCAGNPLDLPDVSVDWKNFDANDRFSEWQIAENQNGPYGGFVPNMPLQMNQNGYWVRYLARNSCGEVFLGPVRILVLSSDDVYLETITACDSYQLPSGEIITESQTIEYEEDEPCLHTVHQPIVINHSDYVVEPITSCHEEYEWHGRTFYHSNQTQYAWDTLQNQNLCDSVVELNLSFDEYSSYTHNRVACESYEWEMNPGHVYYESVYDSVFVPAVGPEDCDTWYYLDLVIGHATEVEGEPMIECSGFEWHGVIYNDDAIIYDSLQTAVTHCDSIVSHALTIIQPYHTEMEMTRCQPFLWYEHYCDQNGYYTHTFSSVENGCDSIVTLHFSLSDLIVHEFDTVACDSFEWYGNSCTESGHTYSHVFQTLQGCDSLVKMHVTLNVMQLFTQFVSACDSIEIGGVMYNQPDTYYIYGDTLHTQNGCDSIIYRINLTVRNSESLGVIEGSHNVYAASNLISGIYRYSIDTTGLVSSVVWSIDNPDWQIVEVQDTYCLLLVTTSGSAVLKANFQTSSCGEMEKRFDINSGFFGLDEQGVEVNVFPNPTKGTVTVEAEGIESLRLTNMMGQTLDWMEYDHADSVNLNLNGFPPSVYLLEIKTINGMVKQRVVVCR